MKKHFILTSFSLVFFLLFSVSNKTYAATNIQNDSTNILLLTKVKSIFKSKSFVLKEGDDIAIKTSDKTKIRGVITKIEKGKIHISTETGGIKIVNINELKMIKHYKERHPFGSSIMQGLGVFLVVVGLILLVLMIISYATIDTGSNFFPILGSSVFVLLELFLGYQVLTGSEKRLSPRKKFRIGKKWKAEMINSKDIKNDNT